MSFEIVLDSIIDLISLNTLMTVMIQYSVFVQDYLSHR